MARGRQLSSRCRVLGQRSDEAENSSWNLALQVVLRGFLLRRRREVSYSTVCWCDSQPLNMCTVVSGPPFVFEPRALQCWGWTQPATGLEAPWSLSCMRPKPALSVPPPTLAPSPSPSGPSQPQPLTTLPAASHTVLGGTYQLPLPAALRTFSGLMTHVGHGL